jgi:tRNA A-37 threonylcarbamoyl transferase component Bud32
MEPLALKIVPSKSRGGAPSLHAERQMLEEAAKSHVSAVTPVGDCKILLDGSATSLLLKPVGSPISRSELRNVEVLRSIFDALFQLHQAQCQHGDPRVENLIRHKQKLLWVDFMSSSPVSSWPLDQDLIKRDTECLVRSVLKISHNSVLPQTVQRLVHEYINDPTGETMQALANIVHTVGSC